MGQQHIRPELPDPAGDRGVNPVFVPQFVLLAQGKGKRVPEVSPDRIVSDTAGPQAVQQLQTPVGRGGHEHAYLAGHPFFTGVGGQRPAEPEHLVVRVGGQEHQVRLVRGGFPLLDLGRDFPLPVDAKLDQVEMPLFPRGVGDAEPGGSFGKGQVFRQETAFGMAGIGPLSVFVLKLQPPGVGMLVPLNHDAGSASSGRHGHLHPGGIPVGGPPVGFIVPVFAAGKSLPPGTGFEPAGGSNILRAFRAARADQRGKDQNNEQGEAPSPDRFSAHEPLLYFPTICLKALRTLKGSFFAFCWARAASSAPLRYSLLSGLMRTACRKD